jgi:exodeoxyribonuclease VII large subunit
MPKPLKSQWSFGELFPPEATRRVLTVSEVTLTVKRLIEGQVGRVWVSGEITNYRLQSSGHAYFSIKDAGSQLSCVLFRDEARGTSRSTLQDGLKVVLQGEMSVYEARGQYQLRVTEVELQGVGALQAAFERLKQKLQAEGLFDSDRKRPLPRFPQRLGIVTSPTGAALRDVLHVVGRRHPGLEIVLAGCRVQGEGAAAEIACGIGLLNEWNAAHGSDPGEKISLILVTRGGGSLEDLWAFNEEVVARAIATSAIPVVSAVGHEIDFTISDFVADFRAATPSAAAELITEGAYSSRELVVALRERMSELVRHRLDDESNSWRHLVHRLSRLHPRRRAQEWVQRLDDAHGALLRTLRRATRDRQAALLGWQQRLLRISLAAQINTRRETLERSYAKLPAQVRELLHRMRARFETAQARLRLLSPQNVMDRGYSITTDAESGRVIRSAGEIRTGQRLRTQLESGVITSVVEGADGE